MKAHLIFTGTELLLGQIVNTNAQVMSKKLAKLGIDIYKQVTVGDNLDRIAQAIEDAKGADLIIINGGLGPTEDDISKEALGKALGLELKERKEALEIAERYFKIRNINYTKSNKRQGLVPEGGMILDNPVGTAPGIIVEKDNSVYSLLPGPPNEMKTILEKGLIPYIKEKYSLHEVIKSKVLKVTGIGESLAEEKVKNLLDSSNPTLAPTAKIGEVHFRITAKADNEEDAGKMISDLENKFRDILGEYVFGCDDEILEEVVGKLLLKHNLKLATAESCTGGLVGNRITNIAGSSEYFKFGGITYSNEAKEKLLGVKTTTLDSYGAVSKETAAEMAAGIRKYANSDIGISITGIAGPGGGTEEKPVGLVYFGIDFKGNISTYKEIFIGDRETIKQQSSQRALRIIWEYLRDYK